MAFLDPFRNLPHVQRVVLWMIGLIAVGTLGYFFLLTPKMLERDILYQRNESLKAEVGKARLDEASMRQFRVQAAALRQRLEAARERMPAENEIPELYRRITELAAQSGLSVALFALKPLEERDVYREVPISITAEGSYHQLAHFFEQIGRLPRIVSTTDMRLVGIERPTGSVRAELGLAIYVARPEGTPGPARPLGAASAGPPPGSR